MPPEQQLTCTSIARRNAHSGFERNQAPRKSGALFGGTGRGGELSFSSAASEKEKDKVLIEIQILILLIAVSTVIHAYTLFFISQIVSNFTLLADRLAELKLAGGTMIITKLTFFVLSQSMSRQIALSANNSIGSSFTSHAPRATILLGVAGLALPNSILLRVNFGTFTSIALARGSHLIWFEIFALICTCEVTYSRIMQQITHH